jgi:cyclohexa-1,5-dienecarbonyl-CoA hydratase
MSFRVDVTERVCRLTLDAPPLNILTTQLQSALANAVRDLNARRDFNLLVLRSGLPGKFSAGADVREHVGRDNVQAMLKAAHGLIAAMLRSPVPTLCAVDGPCLGGAFELALACDQVVATPESPLGLPEITLGCLPPTAMVLAPMKLPAALAAELIQGGQTLPAKDFAARGGGWRVTLDGDTEVRRLEQHYANLPRGPLVEATRLLRCGAAERFEAAVGAIERDYLERLLAIADANEGPQAFLQKRKPRWDHQSAGE